MVDEWSGFCIDIDRVSTKFRGEKGRGGGWLMDSVRGIEKYKGEVVVCRIGRWILNFSSD